MSLYSVTCVLFAGGKSSRMGRDKAHLPFAGANSLAQYQYERLKKVFSSVYISTKESSTFEGFDPDIIEDIIAKEVYAPTAGFVNLFKQLKDENVIFVLSVDTPFVSKEIIDKFFSVSYEEYDAVIARTPGGIHPLCGIYTRKLEDDMLKMLHDNDHRLGKLLSRSNVYYIDIDDEDALLNMNTPQEYEKALGML